MSHRLLATLLALCCGLALLPARAEEQPARIIRDTTLMSEPFSDAARLRALPAQTPVTAGEREGGWYKITLPDTTRGWVRMYHLRLGTEGKAGDSGLASTLRFLESGRSGSSGVTVATGIRGLDAADMSNAVPDHHALGQLKAINVSRQQVQGFAAHVKLKARKLAYFQATGEKPKPAQKPDNRSPWDNGGLW